MAKIKPKDNAFKKNMIHKSQFRTICEVLREIHWGTDDPDIRLKAIEASMMAKAMSRKLIEYNFDVEYNFNINIEMEYEELTDEQRETISAERWAQYKEELARGIDHPMNKEDDK